MAGPVRATNNGFTVSAYRGDAKTLLAFNLAKREARNLAGFTVEVRPQGRDPYYLHNMLQFEHPELHAQVAAEPAQSSVNSPFHKFRWLHVPGSVHQGRKPFYGPYEYVVTPRYFDADGSMTPIDRDLGATVPVDVRPFKSEHLELAFTRGYVQTQGYVNHFGPKARIDPNTDELLFDTTAIAGTDPGGHPYTYEDEYRWLGFTAREKVFDLLDEVLNDKTLRLEMFAYDLNEPDVIRRLLDLAQQGRVRVILDNAALHHNAKTPKPEDDFESRFRATATAPAAIKRGKFGRYAHDKVLVVSDQTGAKKVLTGSTNFSVTGLYVNSNHVLVSTAPDVAAKYASLFNTVWDGDVRLANFLGTPLASEEFATANTNSPAMTITFAPHSEQFATKLLDAVAARIAQEGTRGHAPGSVLFAVMDTARGQSPVLKAVNEIHRNDKIFSFGISDDPAGIALYEPRRKTGVIVTGKPVRTQLPKPFNQVPGVRGHQIHHKFVVCGFGRANGVVYCGSSNLAQGGEENNGDNLLEIRDPDVVTAFGIEALALVDHFQFLNRSANGNKPARQPPPSSPRAAAASKGWFLSTTDAWTNKYFDPKDLYYADRRLFGA
jgi:hypothetical protein